MLSALAIVFTVSAFIISADRYVVPHLRLSEPLFGMASRRKPAILWSPPYCFVGMHLDHRYLKTPNDHYPQQCFDDDCPNMNCRLKRNNRIAHARRDARYKTK